MDFSLANVAVSVVYILSKSERVLHSNQHGWEMLGGEGENSVKYMLRLACKSRGGLGNINTNLDIFI